MFIKADTRMLKRFKGREQGGDTLVEVLIAVAIISLVLVGAYISTNGNINVIEDTQEHGEALALAQSQVEYLRQKGSIPVTGSCFDPNTGAYPPGICVVTPNGAGTQPAFDIIITKPLSVTGAYVVDVRWDSLVKGSRDDVTLYYRAAQ